SKPIMLPPYCWTYAMTTATELQSKCKNRVKTTFSWPSPVKHQQSIQPLRKRSQHNHNTRFPRYVKNDSALEYRFSRYVQASGSPQRCRGMAPNYGLCF